MGPPGGTRRQESQVFIKLPSVGLFYTASKAWGVAFYFLFFIPMIPGGWYH